jgi:ABC-type sugar transport system ATPase subunit
MTLWQGHRQGAQLACRGVGVPLPPGLAVEGEVHVGIRPEDLDLSVDPIEGGWPARRLLVEPLGSRVLVTLGVGGEQARALAEPRDWPEALWMRWPEERVHWFDARTGARLTVPADADERR